MGETTPGGAQYLLERAQWDADAVRDARCTEAIMSLNGFVNLPRAGHHEGQCDDTRIGGVMYALKLCGREARLPFFSSGTMTVHGACSRLRSGA